MPGMPIPRLAMLICRLDGVWGDDEGEARVAQAKGGKGVSKGGAAEVDGAATLIRVIAFECVVCGDGGEGGTPL